MKKVATYLWQHGTIALLSLSLIACTQAQVDLVLSDIDLVLQTANSLSAAVGAISPAEAAALSLLTGLGTKGIEAVKKAYDDYEANKNASNLQNVLVAAQSIQSNLPQELAALHISNQNAVSKASAWVNLVTDVAGFVVTTVSSVQAGTSIRRSVTALPTPERLQVRWQSEVCAGDTGCGNLVKVHHKRGHLKL